LIGGDDGENASNDSFKGMSSVASSESSDQSNAIRNIIKSFKEGLEERKTPRNQVLLNRFIVVALLVMMGLSGLDFYFVR
jgi:hypothetical protein